MFKRVLLALGYIGLTLLVIAITAGLVAYGSGYAYNLKTGKLIRTGLIIIQSTPSGIPVTQNGKRLKKKTPYRVSVESGMYTFELSRDGYYPWTKTLQSIASEVTLAQYVTLIPRDAPTTVRVPKTIITNAAVSTDHRHVAYVTGGTEAAVFTLDLDNSNAKPVRLYSAKTATDAAPAESLASVQWSDDASHLLIVSSQGGVPVHRLATAGSTAEPVNLTAQYGFNFTGLEFSSASWQQLYWISPDGLRRLDVGSQSVSAVLADKVSQFKVVDDRVLYVQATDLGRSLFSLDRNGRKSDSPLITVLPESEAYSLDAARYNNEDHIAVVPSRTGIGTLYSGVDGPNPVAKTLAHNVSAANFSPDGHLLIFSSATSMRTYDLERSEVDSRTITYDFPNAGAVDSFSWFDNFHILMNRGGRLVWSEFDGTNQVDLGASASALLAQSSNDLKSIFRFEPGADGVQLQQTDIRK